MTASQTGAWVDQVGKTQFEADRQSAQPGPAGICPTDLDTLDLGGINAGPTSYRPQTQRQGFAPTLDQRADLSHLVQLVMVRENAAKSYATRLGTGGEIPADTLLFDATFNLHTSQQHLCIRSRCLDGIRNRRGTQTRIALHLLQQYRCRLGVLWATQPRQQFADVYVERFSECQEHEQIRHQASALKRRNNVIGDHHSRSKLRL